MVVEAAPLRRPREVAARTCDATGLRIDRNAQRLIIANAVAAVVFLLIGGTMALLVALTRWEGVGLLANEPTLFYRFLTAHGQNMLLFWILFFEVAGLYLGGTVLLNSRLPAPRLGWGAFALMLSGAVLTNVVVFAGQGDVMWDAYVPLQAHPLFYLGYILFAVGAFLAVGLFFAALVVGRTEGHYRGSLPLVTFGLATAAIIAVFSLLGGVITFVPAFFWSLGLINLDAELYRLNLWSIGHGTQQINLAAMVSIWYLMAAFTTGARVLNHKLSRLAFILYILFINLGSVHHLLGDPGLTRSFKVWTTSYAMYAAVLGSMIHAYSIPASIEVAQRARGYTRTLFEWLRRAPWTNPGFSALVLSMIGFGFLGGTTGVAMGHGSYNLAQSNTLFVPGHFHGTVVVGTTLAFMGATYYLVPLIARREIVGLRLARIQPWLYFGGLVLFILGMMRAGAGFGVPRRTVSIGYEAASIPVTFASGAHAWLAVFGIGALLAIIGGALYVGITVASLLAGRRVPDGEPPATAPVAVGADQPTEGHATRGTLVIVFGFLAFFIALILWHSVNLANLWPIG